MRGDDAFWGGLVCVGVPLSVIALAIVVNWLSPKKRPTLLGTTLASFENGLHAGKSYDVTITAGERWEHANALHRFSGVKILGATGTTEKGWFDEWVVLEHADGHKSYVPRTRICFIDESVGSEPI